MLTTLSIIAAYLFGGWVSWRWRLAYRPPHNGIWYDAFEGAYKEEGTYFLCGGPARRKTHYNPANSMSYEHYGPSYRCGHPPALTYLLDQLFWLPRLVWYGAAVPIAQLWRNAFVRSVNRCVAAVDRHVVPELEESGDVLAEEFEKLEAEAAAVEDVLDSC